jgi:hypothetical protein
MEEWENGRVGERKEFFICHIPLVIYHCTVNGSINDQ